MKVAIIHSHLNSKGGTQRKTLETAVALQALGHEITLYVMAYDVEKCYPALLSKLKVVPLSGYNEKTQKSKIPFLRFLNYFLYSRNENNQARRLAVKIRQDTEVLCPFDRLAYRVAVYYKKKIHCSSVAIMDDIYTKLWAEWRKSQFDPSHILPLRRKIFYTIVDWYETRKYILPHERIVVLDQRTKSWVKEFFGKNADIVRNGLELSNFPFVQRTAPAKNSVRLLSTGIFFLHRRYEDIINAINILRSDGINATLAIVGNYSGEHHKYYETVQALVEKFDLGEYILFLGNISDAELLTQYKESAIYISANHLQSWGLAPFEAMASGMPAIISNSTGAAEVLTDHKNALLIPPKSPEKIADAVRELLERPGLYDSLSKEGRRFVEIKITWQNTAKELAKILEPISKFHIRL